MSEQPVATAEQEEVRARELLARMQAAAAEAATLTATACTADGTATVVVGAGGSVLSIDVRSAADTASLGPALVAAISAASADVTRRGAALLAERTGIDITEQVLVAQVLAGDPVAVGLAEERTAGGGARASDDAGDVDWLDDDPR